MTKTVFNIFIVSFMLCVLVLLRAADLPAVEQYRSSRIPVYLERERKTVTVPSFRKRSVAYVSISDLCDILNVPVFYNQAKQKIELRLGAKALKITGLNPYLLLDDKVFQMALPADLTDDGSIAVPLAIFLDCVGHYFPSELRYDPNEEKLYVPYSMHNITAVNVEERANGTMLRFLTNKAFRQEHVEAALNQNFLEVTFLGGTLDTNRIASDRKIGIVSEIIPFQFQNASQITFRLTERASEYQVYVDKNEVLITLRGARSRSQPERRREWSFKTIILDPGHGGREPGAVGPVYGTLEKTVNLAIAKQLKQLLEQRLGVTVLMTRETDVSIDLENRTLFANQHKGDLFISIHANGNNNPRARGFSVYVMGPAKTEEAIAVAERENSVVQNLEYLKEFENETYILNSIAQSSHLREGIDLARMMVDEVTKRSGIPVFARGVMQANFIVLWRAAMPAILVETAHLSNRHEERLLRTRSEQVKIAEALYEAIARFKQKYETGTG